MSNGVSDAVLDTGVPMVANGAADVSLECQLTCVRVLREVVDSGLALDDLDLIFTEYRRGLSLSGQPGPGDVFVRWVHDNRFNPTKCTQVPLTAITPGRDDFVEFPIPPELASFDRADRKFAAVAKSCPAPLKVSVDRGWRRHESALRSEGVDLEFLCPDDITE